MKRFSIIRIDCWVGKQIKMKKENKIIDFSPFVNISGADNMVWRYIDYSNSQSTEEGEVEEIFVEFLKNLENFPKI